MEKKPEPIANTTRATKRSATQEYVSLDPPSSRRPTFQRNALVAGGLLGLMLIANQLAQKFYIDIEVPEPVLNTGYVPHHAHREAPRPTDTAAVEPLPVLPRALESDRAPASTIPLPVLPPQAPEAAPAPAAPAPTNDHDRGARLAALGKDLMSAVEEGNLKLVTKLVDEDGVSPDFTIDDLGRSPFVRAAASGRVSIMQFLVSKRVALSAIDYNGNNALMWSAINGHEKTAAYLLTLGLSPSAKREDGKTALQLAKQYRQKRIENLLSRFPASAARKK